VHEAVFEDVFLDHGDAVRLGGEGQVLGLHIGEAAGVLLGGDVGGDELARAAHADGIAAEGRAPAS